MLDLVLTIAHHILVFVLIGALAAEIAAIRPNMRPDQIDHLAKLDTGYGLIAMLVIVAGVARVFWGAKGPDFFIENPWFWAKMVTFGAIALISIPPTLRIRAWNKAAQTASSAPPDNAAIVSTRNFMLAEAALVLLLLAFAAMMARYGQF